MRPITSAMWVAISALFVASAASAQPNPDKNAYFGETHVHTSWSLDAFALGKHADDSRPTRTSTSRASRSSILSATK